MVALALALLIAFPNTKAALSLDEGWTQITTTAIVAAYKGPNGAVLAVTRTQVPNSDAWRQKKRDAYVAEIEKGALAAVPGGKKLAKRIADANGVPALDLEIKRSDGTLVVIRYLLFRTYALAAAVEVPAGADAAAARAITASFAPPKP